MSHGSPIPIGAFESPSVRLARLRSQFDSTSQSMGGTVTDLVDLEARRRAMEDNLRRFREVEQQQNLQFAQPRPAFQPPSPEQTAIRRGQVSPDPALAGVREPGLTSLVEDVFRQTGRVAGAPGLEGAFLPENRGGLAPPIPVIGQQAANERLDELALSGEVPDDLSNLTDEQRNRVAVLLMTGQFARGERGDEPLEFEDALQRAEARFGQIGARQEDIAKFKAFVGGPLGTGIVGSVATTPLIPEKLREPIRDVPVIGPALEREVAALSTPIGAITTGLFPAAVGAGAVGGIGAATVAQELGAGEDVQLAAQIAGNVLAPGGGLVSAGVVTKPTRVAARTGRELIGEAVEQARLAPEAGAAPLRGEGPIRNSVIGKLRVASEQAPENWIENARLASQEFGERATRATKLRDDLIKKGVPPQEAILKSTAELRGEMPFRGVTGLDFSPQEELWFWDQIRFNAQYAEGVNVADYMQRMMMRMAVGEARDFPPFIWRILGKAFGEDFTKQLQVIVKERLKAVKVVAEESAAERLAKAKRPPGVTDKTPIPASRGGTQPAFGRGVPGELPEPIAGQTAAQRQQFRADIELGQAATPRGAAPGRVLPTGADLGEQVPLQRTLEELPESGPARTAAEQQQFRAEIELEASPRARGVSPGEVADTTGAQQGILRDATEQFPAPGVALEGIKVKQRDTFLDFLSNTVGLLKPLLSSADISWFRQTSKTIIRNPGAALQSLRKGTKALWSEKNATEWMAALRAEGSTTTGYKHLVITEEGTREIALGKLLEDRYLAVPGTPGFAETGISTRPEFFIPTAASTIPGLRQSGRAFAVGWNTHYQGMMRYWLDKLTKMNRGAMTQVQTDAALTLGQRLTGIGRLGNDNSWFVKALKVLGFAPGYRVSGPEALVTLLSPRTDKLVRRMAAENLISWAIMGNGLMTAAKYGVGATVVTELGATQLGRIKFPGSDSFYNIWGTDNVLARAVLQAITQQRIDVEGNISIVGTGEKSPAGFLSSFTDAALRYLQSGESPVIGLFEELRTGETFIGEKLGWDAESAWKVLRNRLPIVLQDMIDIVQTDGPFQALFSVPTVATGTTGVTSYTPIREQFRTIPKYNSADKELVEGLLDRTIPEPLNLDANEERTLLRFLREDVREWIEDLENKHGPIPSRISMEQIIFKVADEKGLSSRDKIAALFLHKAKSNTDALNKEWIKFLLKNRTALEDFFTATYETDVIQEAQQRAETLGLVPVR